MKINVKGYLTFREVIGDLSIQENESERYTLRHLLERLSLDYEGELGYQIFEPGGGGVREHIAVLINGVHYSHLAEQLEIELKDGDEVAIFPPIAGG